MRRLYLKTQAEVLDLVENTVKDTGNARWANNDIYRAINVALETLSERVKIQQLYTMPDGFDSGVYEYAIPSYVGSDFTVLIKTALVNDWGLPFPVDYNTSWMPIVNWTIEPDGSGGRTLRLYNSPHTEDGRLIWWGPNGEVPLEVDGNLAKLNADITAASTSLVISTLITNVGESGYVKIGGEWISYAGVSFGTATTTLSNLTRGLYGTTAATHATNDVVYWGIAVDDPRLWRLIEDLAVERLNYILLHRGTRDDSAQHERIMGFLADRANNFFRRNGYVSARRPQWKPTDMWR